MIKANELRVGNKVTDEYYESFRTIITVESINDKGINLEIEDDGNWPECAARWISPQYKFSGLSGIPLTPEILEKCGFEKGTPNGGDKQYFKWEDEDDEEDDFTFIINGYSTPECNTLHQLQNLHFTLTGTELNYTP